MSNLYKYYATVGGDSDKKMVVDSNEIISQKIVKIRETFERQQVQNDGDGFTLGLDAEHIEELLDGDEYVEEGYESQGTENFSSAKLEEINESAARIIENANNQAAQLIADAQVKANEILVDGRDRAKEAFDQAREEGRQQGIEEGRQQGIDEVESMKAEVVEYRKQLEAEYVEKAKRMEPELVDILLKIFSEVTKVIGADKKELILTLVNSVMSGTEVSKNYIIKTSREDAAFLRDNKDRIQGAIGRDINIEIVEDPTMKRSQCLIDTDMGVFDCGLDIQLENLMDDIKILACQGIDYFDMKK